MKILITGSEGMLGRALIKAFAGNDIKTVGADIRSAENRLDITIPDEVNHFVEHIRPDIIIHSAAVTDVDGCESHPEQAYFVNAEGTKNMAWAAKNTGSFFIYLSTDYVFDGKKKTPYTEQDKPNPLSVYAKSKLSGEKAVRDILENYFIIRTSWLFGQGGRNFVDSILKQAKPGNELEVVDDQIGSPTYAKDLAGAIYNLLDSSALWPQNDNRCHSEGVPNLCHSEGVRRRRATEESKKNDMPATLHLTNSGSCSWYEFAKEIIRLKGIDTFSITPISSDDIRRPAKRPNMSVLDNSKYIQLTGKALPSWQDALKRYLKEK
jgi:dTDP-4-dehydrorhamnose reductase